MSSTSKNALRKKRGRPATGQNPVTAIRLSPELRESVDDWARRQPDGPSRSQAIRRLVELGLAGASRVSGKKIPRKNTVESAKIAGRQLDRMGDPAATSHERAARKRRLLKGPQEFRELRGDLRKAPR